MISKAKWKQLKWNEKVDLTYQWATQHFHTDAVSPFAFTVILTIFAKSQPLSDTFSHPWKQSHVGKKWNTAQYYT